MNTERRDDRDTPEPGTFIEGRYEVSGVLGRGGMGIVLSARHRLTGVRVAIKMLHSHLRLRRDVSARFLVEARVPAAIAHPAIVTMTDAGITADGVPYLVMECLDGQTLAEWLKSQVPRLAEIRRIGLAILDCLTAAHAAGFVHRDLKPENIFLLKQSGTIKVLDFGIAKLIGDGESTTRTEPGMMLGTPPYMSPEQLRSAREVDHRADLWAVGVLLYEMTTGALPYGSHGFAEQLLQVSSSPQTPPSVYLEQVPAQLAEFLVTALAVEPSGRFSSAAEMAAALQAIPDAELRRLTQLDGSLPHAALPVKAAPARRPEQRRAAWWSVPTPHRRRLVWLAIGVAVVATAAVTALELRRSESPSDSDWVSAPYVLTIPSN